MNEKPPVKIIAVDNFDRDDVSDVLIADNVHPHYAEQLVEWLNRKYPDHFKVVPLDHKLYKFEGY